MTPHRSIDLSPFQLQTILDDGAFVMCRGRRTDAGPPPASVLVVMTRDEHPRPEWVQMLEHESALAADLDRTWAVLPLACIRHQGRTCLVLEDPGGQLLAQMAGTQPIPLGRFLRLAIGLTAALGALHRRGIVHKDVTPAHVIVDEARGQVWLTGFRIASRLGRERLAPEPPEVIAGTLPYMAPEQTGRMNRSIDPRTDLYGLGVTLYEVLTGTLPFTAADPVEWVHCHVARQPIPPAERVRDLPPQVSAIIMRLLAKTPEQRYQTAGGLERDLRRCLTVWETGRGIEAFRLGEYDIPDRLLIPEQLYGRDREAELLRAAFDRVATNGTLELVLVSGASGIGKSSVVHELHTALVPRRGLFASGKFDQSRRGIPYATLAQAFQSLVRALLAKREAELSRWRARLADALGGNGELMVDLAPDLELIVGPQPPVPDLPPREAQMRFQLVSQRFIAVFAQPEHPLVLFLDDLQWLDTASLDLLEHLLMGGGLRHLLVIGAYRTNEIDAAHPLLRTIQSLRQVAGGVQEIDLSPLARQDVAQLIADALRADVERVAPLAQLVGEKTAGNPFFITQFLTAISNEGLLAFDHAHARWSWDLAAIRSMRYSENVADLMLDRLTRLPAPTQRALRTLSSLGNRADVTTLSLALACSVEQVHTDLWDAVRVDLVERQGGTYRFFHDRVQEAAYALVPEEQRMAKHLRIGRLLLAGTPATKRDEVIFEIVNQLNRGGPLMTSGEERDQLAELDLIAGRRARGTAAYATALHYFVCGAALLPEDRWESRSALTFALEFGRAECEFVTGELASAEERLSMLAANVTNVMDEGAVASLRIPLYAVLRQFRRGVEIALDCLRKLGIEWSPHPTDEEVRDEYERLCRQLQTRSIESLAESPLISDARIRLTMDVLSEFQGPAHWTDPNLEHLLLLRIVNMSIQYGNTDASTVAYAYLNVAVGARFGQYSVGYRFGLLALELVDNKGLDRAAFRVYRNVAAWALPWARHLREARPLLERALAAGERWRPLPHYLMWMYGGLVGHGLACGDPLPGLQSRAEEGRRRVTRGTGRPVVFDVMSGQLGVIRTLRGATSRFGSFGADEPDEHSLETYLQGGPELELAAGWYCMYKLQALVYAGEHREAAVMATKAQRLLWTVRAEILEAEFHFYAALARLGAVLAAEPEGRGALLAAAAADHQKLLQWTAQCPENFECRAALAGAELARLEQRELEAERLYEQAIGSARANGFVHIEALANELAGRFYGGRRFQTAANAYLEEARQGYLRWGADGKARQMDRLRADPGGDGGLPDARPTITGPVANQELAAVLQAFQAVSGEIVLERVVERLLRMAIEQAGAERGVLLVASGEQWVIGAEATVSGAGVEVRVQERPVSDDVLPESLLEYVARTQELVVLDDASVGNAFTGDPYIRRTHARSILCVPLIKQGRLVALLYLENHLAPDVFVAARTDVLRVIAPQAAMALENSRLYRELERREAKIRRLVDANIIGVVISGPDGSILDSNDAALGIVGYSRQDVQTGRLAWPALTPPEWEAAQTRAVGQLHATGTFDVFETELLRRDGSRVPVLLAGAVVDDTPHQSVVFVIDVTERKRAEQDRERLRQVLADLAHVNRISMMGELAASLSHELKQPITAALTDARTCLRWLNRDEPDLERATKALSRVLNSGTRAAAIIDHLRSFYRKDAPPERELVDLNGLASEMLVLLRSEARQHGVSLHADLSAHRSTVAADRVQLQQVLMNLMLNAIEAMKHTGGDLIVRSSTARNGQLTISVSDTGVGLPEGHPDEIFAPFYSTKSHGSGMGLTISRSIIESHGGRLWATDNAGQGATFHFTLPTGAIHESVMGSER